MERLCRQRREDRTPPRPGGKKREEVRRREGETFEKGQASVFACKNCVALSLQRVGGSDCRRLSSVIFFFLLDVL